MPLTRRGSLQLADILDSNDFAASTATLEELVNSASITPYEFSYIARAIALLDQPQVAMDYWQTQPPAPGMWESCYRDMRQEPAFQDYLRGAGLLEYWQATGKWPDICRPVDADIACE